MTRWAAALCALAAGLVAAEAFLRLILPVEIRYETWFTPGIHQYDSQLGFVCTPGYEGLMRHPDGVYRGVPLRLDANGMRIENEPPPSAAQPRRVLAIGGRSVMMSYGLPDDATLTAALVRHARGPISVQNSAWAGWSLWGNWLTYRRFLQDEPWDLAIVAIYNENWGGYNDIHSYEWNWPQAPEETVFAQLPGVRLWPTGLLAHAGRWPYRSYLLYGWLRAADGVWDGEPAPPPLSQPTGSPEGFVRYLDYIRGELAKQGTRTLFVCLPWKDHPADYYAPLTEAFPADFDWVDLHRELAGEVDAMDWIGMHHYSAPLADAIAKRLAPHVDAALEGQGRNVER